MFFRGCFLTAHWHKRLIYQALVLTYNNDFSWRCLGRNASRGDAVIYHKIMVSRTAGEGLAVEGHQLGLSSYVQVKRTIGGGKVHIKIPKHHIIPRSSANDYGLILWWINK